MFLLPVILFLCLRRFDMAELIIMFFCGFFFAVAIMGIVIVSLVYKDHEDAPSTEDMDQMCIWYEE